MSRATDSNTGQPPAPGRAMGHSNAQAGSTDRPAACTRADLTRWSADGGPLPARLAAHVRTCPSCAEQVHRINEVHASLMLLRTQAAPPELTARANGRALRFLRRAARASAAAERLLRMRPDLTAWQRTQIHVSRMSIAAAAAVLILLIRAGTLMGVERTRILGEQLAAVHWDRHIDPDGEFFGPRDFA